MNLFTSNILMAMLLGAACSFCPANESPIANAGEDQTVSVGANCQATVTLDGSLSSDSDGGTLTYTWTGDFTQGTATGVNPAVTFSKGVHTVTLTVDDGQGGTATDTVGITVEDKTAPTISGVTANPATLWPPNHKMHTVTVSATAIDNCDAQTTCKIVSVTSSETTKRGPKKHGDDGNGNGSGKGPGNGNKGPKGDDDFVITGDMTVDLRAERSGQAKSGRVYTITIQCSDSSGNSVTSTVTVTVPHDQGHRTKAGTF